MLVIDPPFILQEVWEQYALSVRLLAKPGARILICTIPENASFLQDLFGVQPRTFWPSCPNLGYQFCTFTNYESARLDHPNPEVERS